MTNMSDTTRDILRDIRKIVELLVASNTNLSLDEDNLSTIEVDLKFLGLDNVRISIIITELKKTVSTEYRMKKLFLSLFEIGKESNNPILLSFLESVIKDKKLLQNIKKEISFNNDLVSDTTIENINYSVNESRDKLDSSEIINVNSQDSKSVFISNTTMSVDLHMDTM